MSTSIKQLLPAAVFQAAINATSPSAGNPFATISDVTAVAGAYLPLAGGTMTGNITVANNESIVGATNGYLDVNAGTQRWGNFGVDVVGILSLSGNGIGIAVTNQGFSKFGEITVYNNDLADRSGGSAAQYPVLLSSQSSTIKQNVSNAIIIGGNSITAKTDNTAYVNQLGFNAGGGAFETILDYTTATQDNTITLPNASGTVALAVAGGYLPLSGGTMTGNIVSTDGNGLVSPNGKSELLVRDTEITIQSGSFGVDKVGLVSVTQTVGTSISYINTTFTKLGQIAVYDNDSSNPTTGASPQYPTALSTQSGVINQNVINSNALGGLNTIVKTDNTAYTNQIGFNSGEAFETILDYTTATADNTITLPNASGTVALTSDISGDGIYTGSGSLSASTTITQASNDLVFATTGNANTLKIDALNGRVGIGHDTPLELLHTSGGDVQLDSFVGINTSPNSGTNWRTTIQGAATDVRVLHVNGGYTGLAKSNTARIEATHANATSDNNALYLSASGSTSKNIAMIVNGGQVIIGGTATALSDDVLVSMKSTTQGFLPPTMTGAQVEAIGTPTQGLLAYATNAGAGDVTAAGYYQYNGTNWVTLSGAGGGDGIYDGSGTVPTSTEVTLTDFINFKNGNVLINDQGGSGFTKGVLDVSNSGNPTTGVLNTINVRPDFGTNNVSVSGYGISTAPTSATKVGMWGKNTGSFGQTDLVFGTVANQLSSFNTELLQSDEKMRITYDGLIGIGTDTPTSLLHVAGAVRVEDGSEGLNKVFTCDATGLGSWKSLTNSVAINPVTPYTTSVGEIILWDCTAGNKTVNLPAAASSTGQVISVKKTDASLNTLTIDPDGAELIEEGATAVLTSQYECITFVSDGTGWYIVY